MLFQEFKRKKLSDIFKLTKAVKYRFLRRTLKDSKDKSSSNEAES